jgi:hypothetical protein
MIVPSPHFGEHRFPGTRHSKPLSTLQVLEQPSPLVVLPSSQVSLPSSTPSPHLTTGQVQAFPGVEQMQPVSSWQVLEQPSLLTVLPSSQDSPSEG